MWGAEGPRRCDQARVQVGEPVEDLGAVKESVCGRIALRVLLQMILQGAAERQVHDEVDLVIILEGEVQVGDESAGRRARLRRREID